MYHRKIQSCLELNRTNKKYSDCCIYAELNGNYFRYLYSLFDSYEYLQNKPPSKVLLRFMRAVISFECAGRQNITRLTRLDGGLFIIHQNKLSVSARIEYHFQQGGG